MVVQGGKQVRLPQRQGSQTSAAGVSADDVRNFACVSDNSCSNMSQSNDSFKTPKFTGGGGGGGTPTVGDHVQYVAMYHLVLHVHVPTCTFV